jgi:hypothetical protein
MRDQQGLTVPSPPVSAVPAGPSRADTRRDSANPSESKSSSFMSPLDIRQARYAFDASEHRWCLELWVEMQLRNACRPREASQRGRQRAAAPPTSLKALHSPWWSRGNTPRTARTARVSPRRNLTGRETYAVPLPPGYLQAASPSPSRVQRLSGGRQGRVRLVQSRFRHSNSPRSRASTLSVRHSSGTRNG